MSAEHFVVDDSEGPDVSFGVVEFSSQEFGTHVEGGAEPLVEDFVVAGVEFACEAQVYEKGLVLVVDDDVGGFEVSVDYLFGDEVFYSSEDVSEYLLGLVGGEALSFFEDGLQGLSSVVFLHQVEVVVFFKSVQQFQHVGRV